MSLGAWLVLTTYASAETEGCRFGNPHQIRHINGFLIRLDKVTSSPKYDCLARVIARDGKTVFKDGDWDVRVLDIIGRDVNGDGSPDVVFEGYSGGAHCCWTYWVVSLGNPPGLIRRIYNQRDGEFLDLDKDGRIEFVTLDGSFDYFDDMSHAFSPFPTVILRLEGNKLWPVSNKFWPRYQRRIADSQRQLSKQSLLLFRADERDVMHRSGLDWLRTRQRVLEIVLAYLYGGREAEAWAALREMWPASDIRRIRHLIIQTSREGFLADPNSPKYGQIE